jgi:hypothetical protein
MIMNMSFSSGGRLVDPGTVLFGQFLEDVVVVIDVLVDTVRPTVSSPDGIESTIQELRAGCETDEQGPLKLDRFSTFMLLFIRSNSDAI